MYKQRKKPNNRINQTPTGANKFEPLSAGYPRGLSQKNYLKDMHEQCIFIHMRTTINIDDIILEKASTLTGIKEKTALVRKGLETLIAVESSKRLAKLGGTEKQLRSIPRRRFS